LYLQLKGYVDCDTTEYCTKSQSTSNYDWRGIETLETTSKLGKEKGNK